MGPVRTPLLILLGLLACAGMALIVLAGVGDAAVTASTGGVYGALQTAGAADNIALRNDLYAVVLRLKGPWALVNLSGVLVLVLALAGVAMVWRKL